jgi:hypothetical protein
MSLDFGKYLETYQSSGDEDDDEVNGMILITYKRLIMIIMGINSQLCI